MTTSEPTTGEIVRDLRRCFNEKPFGCVDCACRISSVERFCDYDKIAGRLESQEREIERLRQENKAMNDHVLIATGVAGNVLGYSPVTICGIPIADAVKKLSEHAALTARAEQAEANMPWVRIDGWDYFCQVKMFDPKANQITVNDKKYGWHTVGYEKVKEWRGRPQDGDGK